MLNSDLADLYGVETRILNQALKRSVDRFPCNFMFRINGQRREAIFTQLRRIAAENNELKLEIEEINEKLNNLDKT